MSSFIVRPETIRIDKTAEYPVRYAAFTNPCILFENVKGTELVHPRKGDKSNTSGNGGHEYAVYHEPFQNRAFPHIQDGIYAEIVSYQGIDYLVSCHATRPTRKREQDSLVERVKTYEEAKALVLAWIPVAQTWIREDPANWARSPINTVPLNEVG